MDLKLKNKFTERWNKYFGNRELPITFYYSNDVYDAKIIPEKNESRSCLICELAKVRKGESVAYSEETILCRGAKRYTGYKTELFENFRYFLSCGIPGKLEGERYKQNPEIADNFQAGLVSLPTEKKYLIFKRWDKLTEKDEPVAVIFYATPDILSGLFTLANFDSSETNNVITPFAAGCGSIIHYPTLENLKENPKCILGMFDPSARPCVEEEILTFSIPIKRFEKIAGFIDESFLITETWNVLSKRIKKLD